MKTSLVLDPLTMVGESDGPFPLNLRGKIMFCNVFGSELVDVSVSLPFHCAVISGGKDNREHKAFSHHSEIDLQSCTEALLLVQSSWFCYVQNLV